ncbi:NAD(P)-binding protein [Eremomyces bilateralis CBS 781.70]|uniref:NAD(P)-binding protein n=1 Tax=Eremomyces bilateralis CBS 781.70 TaxID=1392243 RepID=A0A6G1FVA0_9PEZI|nr:NAD(P)-binding protein [Eremomyces bilateralis CBS 781.70]KAF1809825.1 NAD(P)-binding protein [Eremomyces bilateralis CBS 781.70]
MSEIKSVAIAGASGTLGPHVLKALIDAQFQVKVLARSKKPGEFDAGVNVVEVDFTSVESLTAALKGIDAVVSTVAGTAIKTQTVLIDAAAVAGVKRFIPSEYGSVTTNPKLEAFPLYENVFKIKHHLQEKANAGQLTWTVLACGAFLEFLFAPGEASLLDFTDRKATLLDEGDNRLSSTSLATAGKAIAGILKNLEATKNRVVKVSEVILTQNQLLKIAERLRPGDNWEISKVAASAVLKEGLDELSAGDFSSSAIFKVINGTGLAGETYGSAYDETDNELLGVKELTEEDLKKFVVEKLA